VGIRSELRLRCPDLPQALALLEERVGLGGRGRLATTLAGLDEALGGGIPLGKLTEVVGPSGIGKTQVSCCFFGLNFLTPLVLIAMWMYQFFFFASVDVSILLLCTLASCVCEYVPTMRLGDYMTCVDFFAQHNSSTARNQPSVLCIYDDAVLH
jgi:hypothetical protein